MKGAIVTLLSLYLLCGAYARNCVTNADGSQCCGLVVGTFAVTITDAFAQSQGYYSQNNIPVCYNRQFQSTILYDQLLATGAIDIVEGNNDNVVFRRLNRGTNISVIAGVDGDRGFYLIGNTKVLGGYNSVAALQGQNIVVDSVDSGYVTGLRKVLYDYGVTNFTFIPYGSNRAGIVAAGNLNGVPIAATMNQATAPYLITYPTVLLAPLFEHLCPIQGNAYAALQPWLADPNNFADLTAYFRAQLQALMYVTNPSNAAAVKSYIGTANGITDSGTIELIYDDYVHNPATGLTPFLTPNKEGLRNNINTRIQFGLSPYPVGGVDALVANQPGGFVDLRALQAAQASLSITYPYDNVANDLAGCPVYNKGTVVPQAPYTSCSVNYQPNQYNAGSFGFTIQLTLGNTSALFLPNGQYGYNVTFNSYSGFTYQGTPYGDGTYGEVATSTGASYFYTNPSYYNQNSGQPVTFGSNANTGSSSDNRICGVKINGLPCVPTNANALLNC